MLKNNGLIISKEAMEIGQAMTAGILLEVSCDPSPGLVSPYSMGSHRDMNFQSFMLSSSVIAPYFSLFAQMGIDWDDKEPLLDSLRTLGMQAEEQFLKITEGVNTQRGILFLGGIVAAASGIAGKKGDRKLPQISHHVSKICEGIVKKELESLQKHPANTNGEKLYLEQGITGIRGEVESGLPSITEIAYPQLLKAMETEIGVNGAMVDTLLHLFLQVEDTTVLSRLGMEGLRKTQSAAKLALDKGSVYTERGRKEIEQLNRYFIKENISPGGCADLLAVTLGIYILEGHKLQVVNTGNPYNWKNIG